MINIYIYNINNNKNILLISKIKFLEKNNVS